MCQGIVKDGKAESGDLNVLFGTFSIQAVKRLNRNFLLLMVILGVAGVSGFFIWRFTLGEIGKIHPDSPLPMPDGGVPDFRFHIFSAWEDAAIPKAVRFDPPMGSEHGALVYNAQKFWEMNEKRGGRHTGDDLNGIGGMNTDLGDPVFAVADGRVVYAGEPSPGWGKVVVVAHKTPDGRSIQSMYAHLHRIEAAIGQLVARGGRIGTVGTANGFYPAHLHFEMRASDGVDIGGGYAAHPFNRVDPAATIGVLRNAAADELSPSPLGRMIREP